MKLSMDGYYDDIPDFITFTLDVYDMFYLQQDERLSIFN